MTSLDSASSNTKPDLEPSSQSTSENSATSRKGLFICLEGPDRAGKSSMVKIVEQMLKNCNIPVVVFKFPTIQIDKSEDPKTLAVKCMQDMILNYAKISEHLKKGTWVVADRWTPSNYVYSLARGVNKEFADIIRDLVEIPCLMILLIASPETCLERYAKEEDPEETIEFQSRVFNFYQEYANRKDILKIDANRGLSAVAAEILGIVGYIIGQYFTHYK